MTTKHRDETITRPCELCNRDAILYCDSDSAFLCRTCDASVHRANFLVARHLRQPICLKCKSLAGVFFSGASVPRDCPPLCRLCADKNPNLKPNVKSTSLSSTMEEEDEEDDDCVSTTESSAVADGDDGVVNKMKTKRVDITLSSSSSVISDGENHDVNPPANWRRTRTRTETTVDSRAEGIFVIWSRRLGLDDNNKSVVTSSACEALAVCLERMNINTNVVLPFRVCLAASFWVGLKISGGDTSTWQNLKKLETVSGVPAKLIVGVERRLARVMKNQRSAKVDGLEEGWAECDI